VCDPSILFLDEPTSGLDSHTSGSLMKRLRMMAHDRHKTVILSIHQPSSGIFNNFDKILLLSRGECVYFGPRSHVISHFHDIGFSIPANYNPADFLLELLMENDKSVIRHMSRTYREGNTARNMLREVDDAKEEYLATKDSKRQRGAMRSRFGSSLFTRAYDRYMPVREFSIRHRVGWFMQTYLVAHRAFHNNLRNPYLLRFQYIAVTILGLILGAVYWHNGPTLVDAQNLLGGIFFILALLSFGSMSSLDVFYNERSLFVRERDNGLYSTSAYYVARAMVDLIPMRVIPTLLLASTTYFMMGLDTTDWINFVTYAGTLIMVSLCASTLCFSVSSISPSLAFANLVTILMLLFCMLFGGFLVSNATEGVLGYLQYFSFLNYGFDLVICQQMFNRNVRIPQAGSKSKFYVIGGQEVLSQLHFDPTRKHIDIAGMCAWFGIY